MIWPFKKVDEKKDILINYKPSIYSDLNTIQKLDEQFKGEVEQKKVTFPSQLGEEHPFDFKQMEELYKKFGFYTAIVDKYIDYIWGPGFYIKCDDERGKEIIEQFMTDVDFATIGRAWTKEGLNKGSGFMEIGGNKKEGVKGLKTLNANYMYVERDKKGVVEGYNQYKGGFDKFAKEKVISFEKDQIAHFSFNIVGDSAYGLGIGITGMKLVDDWLLMNNSRHQLMSKKANAPLHVQLGIIDGDTKILPTSEDIAAFGKDLETMSNKTNWTTGPDVNFKVIDFGDVGDKFDSTQDSDLDMMFYAFQMPPVLMGKANVPEGIAKVQMDAFQRRIQSIQAEIEKVIEQKIFKRVLVANGLDVDIEFEWGTPSVMETEGRLKLVTDMLKSSSTGEAMRLVLEDEFINLLKLDKDEWEKLRLEQDNDEEEERKRLEAQPQPIVPGQNKSFPQPVVPKAEQPKQPKPEEILKDFIKILSEQEQKRNDIFIQQQQSLTEEQKKKEELNLDFIKQIISQMQEQQKEIRVDSKIEQDIEVIKQTIEQKPKTIKQKLKKTSLLPAFRITRKTESYEKKIPTLHIKREKDKENYEYIKLKNIEEGILDINDIQEWLGFNYKDYLGQIKKVLSAYEFNQLKAVTEAELAAGYLSETQVTKLKGIIDNGFTKGTGLKAMARQVDKQVGVKDLYRMTAEGELKLGVSGLPILSRSADKRAIGIVRTEVTRLANAGAVKYYKENGVNSIKHVASFGNRTCEQCAALDGTIYKIGEEPGLPVHPLCRCTYSPVVELK